MPPRKRAAQPQVTVEPASAAEPRAHPGPTTPTKAEMESALEKSAEYLAEQEQPPTDVHPKPTTPSKSEVESALEKSEEHLRSQGVTTDKVTTESRDKGTDAAPVSAGGTNPGLDAAPTYAGRDKTADAAPVFSAPVPTSPTE